MEEYVERNKVDSDKVVADLVSSERFEPLERDLNDAQLHAEISEMIAALPGEGVKVMALIGGAASGKSTLSDKFVDHLEMSGVRAAVIGTDDFVVGTREERRVLELKDPRSKYDFAMLRAKIAEIQANSDPNVSVRVPVYDQQTGLAIAAGEENYPKAVSPVDVLIVQADFPEVPEADISFYLHVPDEIRLQNRIARDSVHRSEADTAKIAENFHYRQQSQHGPYTLAAAQGSDVIIDVHPSDEGWTYDLYRAVAA